jgi:REP element-mobilizing transposase RayT
MSNENANRGGNQRDGGTGVSPVRGERITRRNLPHWQREGAVYFLTWRCAAGVTLAEAERTMVLSAIHHWDNQRWKVYAAVVMRDHVHVLAQPLAKGHGVWEMGELLHSVKSFSAHQIAERRMLGGIRPSPAASSGRIWQDERYDRWIRDGDEFAEKWQYIANNAVKIGLAATSADYPWHYLLEEAPS